ncbi:MAG: 2-oxoacid:ferredoxin oxidoreductase subunit gamma [Eubacteriaceae bacterium]|nr:2-oxoacid:ferredoxin oxidoreductase subunit gamma [Eubacteriaceae bacterium]
MLEQVIVAGFGGQGVLRIGQMIAYAGFAEGKEVTWAPSYGPEMRGGTANCSVVVSDSEIGSAQLLEADSVIAMNLPSLHKFEPAVLKGGKLFINSSVIKEKATRSDISVYYVDANAVAEKIGNDKGGNMVILGAYAKVTGSVKLESLYELVKKTFTGDKAKFVDSNIACIKAGAELF